MTDLTEGHPAPADAFDSKVVRLSQPVYVRLGQLRDEMRAELGRKSVTYSEVIEQLLAGQWHDEETIERTLRSQDGRHDQ